MASVAGARATCPGTATITTAEMAGAVSGGVHVAETGIGIETETGIGEGIEIGTGGHV